MTMIPIWRELSRQAPSDMERISYKIAVYMCICNDKLREIVL